MTHEHQLKQWKDIGGYITQVLKQDPYLSDEKRCNRLASLLNQKIESISGRSAMSCSPYYQILGLMAHLQKVFTERKVSSFRYGSDADWG